MYFISQLIDELFDKTNHDYVNNQCIVQVILKNSISFSNVRYYRFSKLTLETAVICELDTDICYYFFIFYQLSV